MDDARGQRSPTGRLHATSISSPTFAISRWLSSSRAISVACATSAFARASFCCCSLNSSAATGAVSRVSAGDRISARALALVKALDVTSLADGTMMIVEVKHGATAFLTANQMVVLPEIAAGNAIPMGANAARAGLTVGEAMAPTLVRVIPSS